MGELIDGLDLFQLNHIFLSRVCSETAGGLPGLSLDVLAMTLCFNYLA